MIKLIDGTTIELFFDFTQTNNHFKIYKENILYKIFSLL